MILVAGGEKDPNILALLQVLEKRDIEVYPLLAGQDNHPHMTWNMQDDRLTVCGRKLNPKSVFVRNDIFSSYDGLGTNIATRAIGWYKAISGWALAHKNVRILNRNWSQRLSNKPLHLYLADKAGLHTPETLLTNDIKLLNSLLQETPLVVKPINGGDYCRELGPVLMEIERKNGNCDMPAIVQTQLVLPEIRVYGIAGKYFPFNISYDALDYRSVENCTVEILNEMPRDILKGLAELMHLLGMDYGAADFKTCSKTGRLLFLEINSSPMFSRFNYVSNNKLCNAIIDFLVNGGQKSGDDRRKSV